MVRVSILPILTDNYVFILHTKEQAVIVDPGDGRKVLDFLNEQNLDPIAILITHHHPDHTGGIKALTDKYQIPVYCSDYDKNRIHHTHTLKGGEQISLLDLNIEVLDLKGHTLGHIGYYIPELKALFSGDTVFSLGCGRLFEGSADQMWDSFSKIKALPKDTKIYFTHEYTTANLAFAKTEDKQIDWAQVEANIQKPSSPSTLEYELNYNVFLRAKNAEDFKQIRLRKDHFRV